MKNRNLSHYGHGLWPGALRDGEECPDSPPNRAGSSPAQKRLPVLANIRVPGQPTAKGRPRARAMLLTNEKTEEVEAVAHIYTPKRTANYESFVAMAAVMQYKGAVVEGPVEMEILFVMLRPKKPRHEMPITKPDGNNMEAAVFDGLTGIVYRDDSQICGCSWVKRYTLPGEQPYVQITIRA